MRGYRLSRRRGQAGAFAVVFAIMAIVLFGFVGLAVDAARLFVSKGELQNAVDACALAAAGSLAGLNPGAAAGTSAAVLTAAENAGVTAGRRNFVGMQATTANFIAGSSVTFAETLTGTYVTRASVSNPNNIKFVRCSLRETGIAPLVIQVLKMMPGFSLGTQWAGATAVASLMPSSKATCPIPLAVCKKDPAQPSPWGFSVGDWIEGRNDYGRGTFGWVGFKYLGATLYDRGNIDELLAGAGACQVPTTGSQVFSETGAINTFKEEYDTRLGIYQNHYTPATAQPDQTCFSYTDKNGEPNPDKAAWPNPCGAFCDFLDKRNAYVASPCPSHGSQNPTSQANLQRYGGLRRLTIAPVVDCDQLASHPSQQNIDGWACVLLLNPIFQGSDSAWMEFRGDASTPGSPCATIGLPGGSSASGPKVPGLVQ